MNISSRPKKHPNILVVVIRFVWCKMDRVQLSLSEARFRLGRMWGKGATGHTGNAPLRVGAICKFSDPARRSPMPSWAAAQGRLRSFSLNSTLRPDERHKPRHGGQHQRLDNLTRFRTIYPAHSQISRAAPNAPETAIRTLTN